MSFCLLSRLCLLVETRRLGDYITPNQHNSNQALSGRNPADLQRSKVQKSCYSTTCSSTSITSYSQPRNVGLSLGRPSNSLVVYSPSKVVAAIFYYSREMEHLQKNFQTNTRELLFHAREFIHIRAGGQLFARELRHFTHKSRQAK